MEAASYPLLADQVSLLAKEGLNFAKLHLEVLSLIFILHVEEVLALQ